MIEASMSVFYSFYPISYKYGPHLTRGAKTQNFPDGNFLRPKTFRTKCVKSFLTTSLKSAFASRDIAKEAAPPTPVSQSIWTVLKSSGKLAVISKNPDSFEIIRKISNHPENPDNFEIIRKIGSQLENPDSFEIIWKICSHLVGSGQFCNHPENWQLSGKIQTVLEPSGKLEIIWKSPDRFESIGTV